ncbi:hypothetical protein HPB50_017065 [Hyalomma asiaticum]|uniref:Uncharacterized protein n=1 Tax=Hyalomma asiaticum TaxID=266040 RepID=A0ACB7SRL0_HYAAI|nr:hypothetical protein HPB50_017065 [Hyalomma asiaticum]
MVAHVSEHGAVNADRHSTCLNNPALEELCETAAIDEDVVTSVRTDDAALECVPYKEAPQCVHKLKLFCAADNLTDEALQCLCAVKNEATATAIKKRCQSKTMAVSVLEMSSFERHRRQCSSNVTPTTTVPRPGFSAHGPHEPLQKQGSGNGAGGAWPASAGWSIRLCYRPPMAVSGSKVPPFASTNLSDLDFSSCESSCHALHHKPPLQDKTRLALVLYASDDHMDLLPSGTQLADVAGTPAPELARPSRRLFL